MLGMQRQHPFSAVSSVLLMIPSAVRLLWSKSTMAFNAGGLLRSSNELWDLEAQR